MGHIHVVQQGESLAIIAARYGLAWKTIYNDGANADFRRLRPNPHIIYPDDRIYIRDKEIRYEDRPTDQRHVFVAKTEDIVLRIVVKNVDGDVFDNCAYKLEVGGANFQGSTGGDGMIEAPVPQDARNAALTLWFDGQPIGPHVRWQLQIACLDPVDHPSGIQARLNNLGYDCGPVDGILGHRSKEAVRVFQEDNQLKVDGVAGPNTKDKLIQVYGC